MHEVSFWLVVARRVASQPHELIARAQDVLGGARVERAEIACVRRRAARTAPARERGRARRSGCESRGLRAARRAVARRAETDRARKAARRPARPLPEQPRRWPSISSRPMRGWTGSAAICRPSGVMPAASAAPRRSSSCLCAIDGRRMPAAQTRETSPGPARSSTAPAARRRPDRRAGFPAARTRAGCDAPLRATVAGRRPAACVPRGRRADRPRPARWATAPADRGPSGRRSAESRARPLSTTPVTPSIVSEVSATFVARITLRRPGRLQAPRPAARPASRRRVAAARGSCRLASGARRLCALADFADAGQKDEAIARGQFEHRLRRLRRPDRRAGGDRGAAGSGYRPEKCGPGFRSPGSRRDSSAMGSAGERGRHDDDPQLGPHRLLDLPDHGQRQVAGQRALVELVEDDRRTSGRNGSSSSRRSRMPSVMMAMRVRGPTRDSKRT